MNFWSKVAVGIALVLALPLGATAVWGGDTMATKIRSARTQVQPIDVSGPCDEAEHANDPRCTGTGDEDPDSSQDSDEDNSGPSENSGPGSVDDNDEAREEEDDDEAGEDDDAEGDDTGTDGDETGTGDDTDVTGDDSGGSNSGSGTEDD